jgi:hypothetical protein
MTAFRKLILPIILIVAVCFGVYKTIVKLDENRLKYTEEMFEQRNEDLKSYERELYQHELQVLKNEKKTAYIIMTGSVLILVVIAYQALSIILRLPSYYFKNPESFRVVPSAEAEVLQYVKDKLEERQIIKTGDMLAKEDVMRLLIPRSD